jgi:hypothetical protein
MTDEQLEEFWQDYIGDSGVVESQAINQIFARGPFGGLSVREVMEICIHRLGKRRPKIEWEMHQ